MHPMTKVLLWLNLLSVVPHAVMCLPVFQHFPVCVCVSEGPGSFLLYLVEQASCVPLRPRMASAVFVVQTRRQDGI